MKYFVLSVLLLVCPISFAENEQVISFGVVPQQSPEKIQNVWGPILENISQQTGLRVEYKSAKNIPEFEQMLKNGMFDIAYMNPYHYIKSHDDLGYNAFARSAYKTIKGILVTRRDTDVKDIHVLDNKTVAFPAPNAFGATMLIKHYLSVNDVPFKEKYVVTHDEVYRNVVSGKYIAGGGVVRTLRNMPPEIQKQLRIAWFTDGQTPHAIASHPRVNNNIVQKIQNSLVSLANTAEGKALIKAINMKAFTNAENDDWNDVRAIVKTL